MHREHHGIESLPLEEDTIARLHDLEPHHADPFDRMLVCQALQHDLLIVTVDPILAQYPARLFTTA
jgi:PIN domain nuclease of toxin-antitoxin system